MADQEPINREQAQKFIKFITTQNDRGALWGLSGLSKMGKTTLLKKLIYEDLKTKFNEGSWQGLCAYIDLRLLEVDVVKLETEILNSFKEFVSDNAVHTDEQFIPDVINLSSFLKQNLNYQFVLMLDEINLFHRLAVNPTYNLKINKLILDLINNYGVVVIISGRLPLQIDPYLPEETRRMLVAWQEELSINRLTLDTFSDSETLLFLRKRISSNLTPNQEKKDFTLYKELTIQIPGLCEAVSVQKWRDKNWDYTGFIKRWLFGEVGDKEHQNNPPIDKKYLPYYPAIQSLSVLRYFSPPLLERFLIEQDLTPNLKVIQDLMKTEVMIYESPKGYTLGAYGQLLNNILKETNPDQWITLHTWAIKYYYDSAVRYRVNPVSQLREFLYHNMMIATISDKQASLLEGYLDDLRTKVVLDEQAIDEMTQFLFDNNNELLVDATLQEMRKGSAAAAACTDIFVQWLENFQTSDSVLQAEPALQALPSKSDIALASHFVGREREKQEICQAIKNAYGRTTVLAITGSVGVGKTALLQHVIETCSDFTDKKALVLTAPGNQPFNFRLAELRHPRPLAISIARAISNALEQPDSFQAYEKAFNEGLTGLELNDIWLDCYNTCVRSVNKAIVICFDSVERLLQLTIMSDWAAYVFPRLENSVILLAARAYQARTSDTDIVSLLNKLEVEAAQAKLPAFTSAATVLKNFTDEETNTFLQPTLSTFSDLSGKDFQRLTAGNPLALVLLTRLDVSTVRKLLHKSKEPTSEEQSDEFINQKLLSRLGALLVDQVNHENDQLLDVLILARRGLTPKLLAFLRSNGQASNDDIIWATADLQLVSKQLSPLVKTLYRQPIGTENISPDPVLVPHESFLDYKDRQWSFRQSEPNRVYQQKIINYCRQLLAKTDIEDPYYERWVFDTLFYLSIYNRNEAIEFLFYQQETAWRNGRWDFVQQIEDEWHLLNTTGDLFEPLLIREQKVRLFWDHLQTRKHLFLGEYQQVLTQLTPPNKLVEGKTWQEQLKKEIEETSEGDSLNVIRYWIDWSQMLLSEIGVNGNDLIEEAIGRLNAIIIYSKLSEPVERADTQSFLHLAAVADAYFIKGQAHYLQTQSWQALIDLQDALQRYSELGLSFDGLQTIAHITHIYAELGNPDQTHLYTKFATDLCKNTKTVQPKMFEACQQWVFAAHQYALGHWSQVIHLLDPLQAEQRWPGWHFDWQMVSLLYVQATVRLNLQAISMQYSANISSLSTIEYREKTYAQYINNPNVWRLLRAKASSIWGEHLLHILIVLSTQTPTIELDRFKEAMKTAFDQHESLLSGGFSKPVYLACMYSMKAVQALSINNNIAEGERLLLSVQKNLDPFDSKIQESGYSRREQPLRQIYNKENPLVVLANTYYELAFAWLGFIKWAGFTGDEAEKKALMEEAIEHLSEGIGALRQIKDHQELIEPILDQFWSYLNQHPQINIQPVLERVSLQELSIVSEGMKRRQLMDETFAALNTKQVDRL